MDHESRKLPIQTDAVESPVAAAWLRLTFPVRRERKEAT
jgi:hypothetical protein